MTLSQQELLDVLLESVRSTGWNSIVLSARKPFRLRLYRDSSASFDVAVYLWNCTHGGGSARAKDEYRIQITGVVPTADPNAVTLLLGWHEGYQVFAAFDLSRHAGQNSSSPSMQIKESALIDASAKAFAVYRRANQELAIAFRPEMLVSYALGKDSLHKSGLAASDLSLLNDLGSATESDVAAVSNGNRRKVVSTIVRHYRAADFAGRVLNAYSHQCAMCGVQLRLLDAAHIIPVAAPTSTDETRNGIALCKLHHASFDANLVSFDDQYRIQVSERKVSALVADQRADGLERFRDGLRIVIQLPSSKNDCPPANYIRESRRVRRWVD